MSRALAGEVALPSLELPCLASGDTLRCTDFRAGQGKRRTLGKCVGKFVEGEACVAPETDGSLVHLPKFEWIDVDLDHSGRGRDQPPPVGTDLAELATCDQEQIRVTNELVGDGGEPAAQSEGERVIVAERALAADRAGRRDPCLADKALDLP